MARLMVGAEKGSMMTVESVERVDGVRNCIMGDPALCLGGSCIGVTGDGAGRGAGDDAASGAWVCFNVRICPSLTRLSSRCVDTIDPCE